MNTPALPAEVSRYINEVMPKMHGWCSVAKAEHLARSVISAKPMVCIEIGVYSGRSLFAIATALKAIGHGHIIGIDPWETGSSIEGYDGENREWWSKLDHNMIYKQCTEHLKMLALEGHCDLFVGRSDQALPLVKIIRSYTSGPFIDLLHIDGNHSKDLALYDVVNFVPMVEAGGLIYFDDLGWTTTSDAQVELRKMADQVSEVDGCGCFLKR